MDRPSQDQGGSPALKRVATADKAIQTDLPYLADQAVQTDPVVAAVPDDLTVQAGKAKQPISVTSANQGPSVAIAAAAVLAQDGQAGKAKQPNCEALAPEAASTGLAGKADHPNTVAPAANVGMAGQAGKAKQPNSEALVAPAANTGQASKAKPTNSEALAAPVANPGLAGKADLDAVAPPTIQDQLRKIKWADRVSNLPDGKTCFFSLDWPCGIEGVLGYDAL